MRQLRTTGGLRLVSVELQTKRGNTYRMRKTRVANGYSKVLADLKAKRIESFLSHQEKIPIMNALALRGTTDCLHGIMFRSQYITKHHPDDPAYTKRVLVLNELGRKRLDQLKRRKLHGNNISTKILHIST